MKKHPNASDLSAKLSAAASQPAGAAKPAAPVLLSPVPEPQLAAPETTKGTTRVKPKKVKAKEATVIITMRPSQSLWNKFVLKAAERTREQGRVVSAQLIMLEALENSVL
jgi:hypothetical protein